MKKEYSERILKAQFKRYEQLLNKEYSSKKASYKIDEERLLTNYLVHDLATPLSSAYAAFMILEESSGYKTSKEVLSSGKESVQTAVELLTSLKEIKSNKERIKKFNLSDSIEKVITILHSKASKNRITILFCKHQNIFIKNYEKTFQRVLMNLVNNALEELMLCEKEKKQIQINLSFESSYVTISITDNGNGISENIINKIFSNGYSTKKNHYGLGLSFVRKALKEKLKGEIFIESKVGLGTGVFLKLQGFCKN